MSLDAILWFSGSLAEAVVIGLLVYRRVWRTLPVFSAYSVWALFSSVGAYAIQPSFSGSIYLTSYLIELIVDSTLLLGILIELAWSVLRPVRSSLPRGALTVVAVLILGAGAAIWPFAALPGLVHTSREIHFVVQLQQTVSILQIVFFLALIGCSQLLSIGWRDRELQVATGFGFYSIVSLTVAMLHMHQTAVSQYRHLNQFLVAGYLCSLLYWVVSFSQKEAERREFTPQMQNFLLAVAGTARASRVALTQSQEAKAQKRKER